MEKNKSLMLDSKKKGKKKDPHTAKWKRCFEKVSQDNPDDVAAAICTDSIGYEGSIKKKSRRQEESIDESAIINLIKDKENPRMSKKDLLEYISNNKKEIVINTTKGEITEQRMGRREFSPDEWSDFGEPGVKKPLLQYLEVLRLSGLVNMFESPAILNWTRDDLHRWLYGQRSDVESLEERLENADEDEYESIEHQLELINYLLDNKQHIRDVLVRVALKRAEREGVEPDLRTIQRYFQNAATKAFVMFTNVR
jgi:hypothetical protein